MSTFLTDRTYTPAQVAKIAGDLMAQKVTDVEPISQGANSRVYRLSSSMGNYVMKFYFQHPDDPRDRLGTEFKSLSFLWNHGIRQIPQAISSWPGQGCALYALVEGVLVDGAMTPADIDQAVDFLKVIKGLNKSIDAQEFSSASEAYFCAEDIVKGLKTRLKRFDGNNKTSEYVALQEYLQKEFIPLLDTVEIWSKKYLTDQGILWGTELLEQFRTLSPSDFGFHNALRNPAGMTVFLDFEYFGWDDPVKMVADFLWHPAMDLTETMKKKFVYHMQDVFEDDSQFKTRLKAFFPFFGLKWCLIFLNEFVAIDMQRRGFAQDNLQDKTKVRLRQLAKAKALCQQIQGSYKEFPYGN